MYKLRASEGDRGTIVFMCFLVIAVFLDLLWFGPPVSETFNTHGGLLQQ